MYHIKALLLKKPHAIKIILYILCSQTLYSYSQPTNITNNTKKQHNTELSKKTHKKLQRDPFVYAHISNKKDSQTLLVRATIECPNGCKTTIESYANGITKKIPSTLQLKG